MSSSSPMHRAAQLLRERSTPSPLSRDSVQDPATTPSTSSQTTPFSWFSGLRAKIAQLSNMSDWLSQLGLGAVAAASSPPVPAKRHIDRMVLAYLHLSLLQSMSAVSPPGSRRGAHEMQPLPPSRSQSLAFPNGFDTMDSLDSLLLDEIAITPAADDPDTCIVQEMLQQWEFGPSFWSAIEPGRSHDDTLERQHFGPLDNLVVMSGPGQCPSPGHHFQPLSLVHPTWCDKCGDFIWGFLWRAVKCERCNYTCHEKCRVLVTLPCRSTDSSTKSDTFPSIYPSLTVLSTDSDKENANEHFKQNFRPPPSAPPIAMLNDDCIVPPIRVEEIYVKTVEHLDWPEDEYRGPRLRQMIDEYNKSANGLAITPHEDGVNFSGYLQVHMNFTRPINVVAGEKPPTVYDVVNSNTGKNTGHEHRTITSFFLPRNTVKTLHINSATTARHMIVTLLRKFKVADNPRKFALYERIHEDHLETRTILNDQGRRRGVPASIGAQLGRGKKGEAIRTAGERHRRHLGQDCLSLEMTFQWDAFEVPELENFLRILDLEEQQYLYQIRQRFQLYRHHIDVQLRAKGGHPSDPSPSSTLAPPFAGDLRDEGSESSYDNNTLRMLNDDAEQFKTASSRVLAFDNPLYGQTIASTRL